MTIADIEFVEEQQAALNHIFKWVEDGTAPQVLKLFGAAGTGKTTLARSLQTTKLNVVYCAITGKAAYRLRQLGCFNAGTVHSLLYVPTDYTDKRGSVIFRVRPQEALTQADLVVLDEGSMVDMKVGTDLLDVAKKVLVLGDPYQLPPVNGTSLFDGDPDIVLEQIHRQAAGNPIIQAATHVRNQIPGTLPQGSNDIGRFNVIPKHKETAAQDYVDQILVGKNTTRMRVNQEVRARKGIMGNMPEPGERLVCVRNNPKCGLFNGSLWNVRDAGAVSASGRFTLEIENVDDPQESVTVQSHQRVLSERVLPNDFPLDDQWGLFNYGYALTVHKSQGSQWPRVLLYNEAATFRESSWRWLYTGITRAQSELYMV